MFSKSPKNGNVLSEIESQGYRIRRASAPGYLKLIQYPSGNMYQRLNDTSSRKSVSKRTKGQPEGSAVTGKTRKPGVTEMGLVPNDVTGQNNSNLASLTALVVNGEWELILAMSSHYCFITHPSLTPQPHKWGLIIFEISQKHLLKCVAPINSLFKVPHLGDLGGKIMSYSISLDLIR